MGGFLQAEDYELHHKVIDGPKFSMEKYPEGNDVLKKK